ncbi:MAG: CoA pyrophosphatase [Desulfobacterales bacterium]|jgi:hypothetical protein
MNLLDLDTVDALLERPRLLTKQIGDRLHIHNSRQSIFSIEGADLATASAVLFLLGRQPGKANHPEELCLILNKRSANVRQSGDLCCPGGSVSPHLDAVLAKLLRLPTLPLARWPFWRGWRKRQPHNANWLRFLLATGLRESVEEMRLNPFGLKFLGPLPPQHLAMFQRIIYPMVIWVTRQKRFYPNWEVEKIVSISLRDFFNPAQYARYRLRIETPSTGEYVNTFPCFRYEKDDQAEILWGATFRITMVFLNIVFGFSPPDFDSLPEIRGHLSRVYHSNTSD